MEKSELASMPPLKRRGEEKNEFLSSLIASSSEAIIGTTTAGVVLSWNQAAEKMYGYSEREIVGRPISMLARSQDMAEIFALLEKTKKGEHPAHSVAIRKRKDGRDIYVSQEISPVKDVEGLIIGASTITRDITEQKLIEELLQDSEKRYRRLFETAQDAILILDAGTGKILDANPFLINLVGFTKEEILGKQLWEMGAFVDTPASKTAFEELQQKEYIRYEDLPLKTKDGRLIAVEFVSNVYLVGQQKVIQCNIRDITERKKTEKVLHQSEIRYHRLFEAAQDGILILDGDTGEITDINPFLQEMLGYSLSEVIGKKLWDISPFKDILANQVNFAELESKDYIRYENLPLETKDGHKRQVEFVSNVYFVDGKRTIQCNIRDITDRREVEEKLSKSEEKYRNIFMGMQDVYYEASIDGTILEVTPSIEIMTKGQYHRDDLIGKLMSDFYSNTDGRQTLLALLQKQTSVTDYEIVLKNRDGSHVPCSISAKIQVDSHDAPLKIVGSVRDISERKKTEKELRMQSAALNAAANAILITDADGIIQWSNRSFTTLTGYRAEEAVGKNPSELVKSGKQEGTFYKQLWDTILSGKIWSGEMINRRKDGTLYTEEQTITPLLDTSGTVVNFISVKQDISKRKLLEEQLLQMQKLEGLGTLASGIAHDFNNILGIILAYLTTIKLFKDDAKKLDHTTDVIMKAVDRGRALVNQILTFARKSNMEFGPVDVNDVVGEIMTMIGETFPKVITYGQNFGKDIPLISADRSQLHQALLNLCVNARDAMPAGGVLKIGTSMVSGMQLRNIHPEASASSYVCIDVRDTGEGISEDIQKRIFEPFFTTKGKGTGLGLAVVFGIIKTHKGCIDVESGLGKGTTLRVYLPVSSRMELVIEDEEETGVEVVGGTETLLVVEDEENLMVHLFTALVGKGYRVLSADDGLAAVNIYEEHKSEIALVLTDLGLPKITGLDVCARIKNLNPNARIIVATGYLDPSMKADFLKAGVKDFLFKPYHVNDVLKTVRKLMDEKV